MFSPGRSRCKLDMTGRACTARRAAAAPREPISDDGGQRRHGPVLGSARAGAAARILRGYARDDRPTQGFMPLLGVHRAVQKSQHSRFLIFSLRAHVYVCTGGPRCGARIQRAQLLRRLYSRASGLRPGENRKPQTADICSDNATTPEAAEHISAHWVTTIFRESA